MLALMPTNIRLALRSLGRNRLRTFLTMLGMIIGVAAVLTMIGLGTGARASVEGEVSSAGTKLVFVHSGNYTRGGESVGIASGGGGADTLTIADMEAIRSGVKGIETVSPEVATRTSVAVGAAKAFAKVEGVSPAFAEAYSWEVKPGRVFADNADEAVIGRTLADQMFGAGNDPTGKSVELRGGVYQIVGVTAGGGGDQKEELFVPYQKLQATLGLQTLKGIIIAAEKAGEASRIGEDVKALLRKRHGAGSGAGRSFQSAQGAQGASGSDADDFTVETQAAQALTKGLYTPAAAFALANLPKLDEVNLEEMADTLDHASDTMTALLASIAGVSLIVGGIGIMNIMLVSVTERTREIGLRMAAGARTSDVALQFLIEAVTLSVIGGIIGLVLGLVASKLIGWGLAWPVTISAGAIALAMGISALVGLVFGSYPARRASLLDPIDALRTE